jgi:hypothetical protein
MPEVYLVSVTQADLDHLLGTDRPAPEMADPTTAPEPALEETDPALLRQALRERDEARAQLRKVREDFLAWRATHRAEIADHLAHRLAAERLHRAVLDGAALSGAVVQGVLDFAHRVAAGEAESFTTCDLSTPTTGPLSVTIRRAAGVTPAEQLERLAVLAAVLEGDVTEADGARCLGLADRAFLDLKARAVRGGRNACRRWRDTGTVRTTPGASARGADLSGSAGPEACCPAVNGVPKKGA